MNLDLLWRMLLDLQPLQQQRKDYTGISMYAFYDDAKIVEYYSLLLQENNERKLPHETCFMMKQESM